MGDGGAPTRFMIAAACLAAEPVTIDASPRMRERPIAEGVEMLRQLGAEIEYVEEEGRLPVRVVPTRLTENPTVHVRQTASSQFISAVMLIAPWINYEVHLILTEAPTSRSYLDLTDCVLIKWGYDPQGIDSEIDLYRYDMQSQSFEVESDASSAVYFATAATIHAGCRTTICGLTPASLQPDAHVFEALNDLGMIVFADYESWTVEGTGGRQPEDRERDLFDFSQMPDASLAFACCAAVQSHPTRITGLRTLRVKETDRIAALANELRKIGCTVETGEDWIDITPPTKRSNSKSDAASDDRREEDGGRSTSPSNAASPIIIETYNDHRMAMSFAILGLNPPNGHHLAIRNPACVKKSYPTFWKDFAKLYE
jgi:3-phosphoshikimate 1-carboxyvinyltransferase